MQFGAEGMRPFIGRLVQAHMLLMTDSELQLALKPNLAITVGRLGLTNTAEVRVASLSTLTLDTLTCIVADHP